MIPSFFDSPERRAALEASAAAWRGTPFFANSEARGRDGGVDCVRLMHGIYAELGVIRRIEIPAYAMDHGQHSERSLLLEAFRTWPELRARFAEIPCSPANTVQPETRNSKLETLGLRPGDALCFVAGKVPHHGGILLRGSHVLHTLKPAGVHTIQLGAAIRGWRILGQLAAAFRPLPL